MASYFQHGLLTLSDVKDVGHWWWRSQAICLDGRLTLWLPLWISFALPFSYSRPLWISHFLYFSTCMPHYILKVNPINTEITLEDKLLGRAIFGEIFIAWSPWVHFASTASTCEFFEQLYTFWQRQQLIFLAGILAWNKGRMKEQRNVLIYLIPLKCISFSDFFHTSQVSNSVSGFIYENRLKN